MLEIDNVDYYYEYIIVELEYCRGLFRLIDRLYEKAAINLYYGNMHEGIGSL